MACEEEEGRKGGGTLLDVKKKNLVGKRIEQLMMKKTGKESGNVPRREYRE